MPVPSDMEACSLGVLRGAGQGAWGARLNGWERWALFARPGGGGSCSLSTWASCLRVGWRKGAFMGGWLAGTAAWPAGLTPCAQCDVNRCWAVCCMLYEGHIGSLACSMM